MKKIELICSVLLCLVLIGCEKEQTEVETVPEVSHPTDTVDIAVVLPMDSLHRPNWETVEKMVRTYTLEGQAKAGVDTIVSPRFTFYDENTEDLEALSDRLVDDAGVKIIIGPYYNEHMETFTQKCSRRKKPLIAPYCTATEICRINSGKGFFWSLCESDVTQLRLMLAEGSLHMKSGKKMGLIASNGTTGSTYLNWIGYEASELSVSLGEIYQYGPKATDAEIEATFVKALKDTTISVLLCATATYEEAQIMMNANEKYGSEDSPTLMFSGQAFSDEINVASSEHMYDNVYGVTPTADPSRGFENYVRASGISNPSHACLVYDAMEIASLACIDQRYSGGKMTYAQAVADIVAHENADGSQRKEKAGWDKYDMGDIIADLINKGYRYDIMGASGSIQFDPEIQSSSTRTVYLYWHLKPYDYYGDEFYLTDYLDYVTKDGTSRTASNTVNWEQASRQYSKVYGQAVSYDTPVSSRWALLVSGSSDWADYRHTVDVLEMYRLLIKNHYDPSHIIVVAQRDFTKESKNPHPGEIRNWKGECLYSDSDEESIVDYQLSDLKGPRDVMKILNGDTDNGRLKRVMQTDEGTNVLVYWSGHGSRGYFAWGKSGIGLSRVMLKDFLVQYEQDKKYRKMLWIAEPCFSGSVGEAVNDSKARHLLFMTSSNGQEISKTICHDNAYDMMIADLFTKNVVSLLDENPDITYGAFYEQLVTKTWGSHPQIFGADTFDKLYGSRVSEFLR